MTPCKRGVSDLGCGRGHDRRSGQIWWSLTPRYRHLPPRRRGSNWCGRQSAPPGVLGHYVAAMIAVRAKLKARPAGLALLAIGTGLDAAEGGTPRARPCSPHGSPLWVSSPSLYTCLNIPELATFAFGERVNSNANSRRASDRLPKRPRLRSRSRCSGSVYSGPWPRRDDTFVRRRHIW